MGDASVLDDALDFLAGYGPDLANGFTSHAPMVVEALCTLERPAAVWPWLAAYRKGLLPREAPRAPIEPTAWRAALGRVDRTEDWCALLRAELAEAPWREVLARWTERLAPGFCASATHGVLRVAHAARGLARRETEPRRRELADALGAWAANYQTLPTPATRAPGRLAPGAALAHVPLQPQGERVYRGSIVSALEGLAGFAPFAAVIDLADLGGPPEAAISGLTRAFARVYLANARDPLGAIVFVHGVTSAAALRALVPHLPAGSVGALLGYAWQAGAALYSSLGSAPPAPEPEDEPAPELAALVDAAVANGDDHVIKLTAACLGEHALAPAPVYLRAVRHVLGALGPLRR